MTHTALHESNIMGSFYTNHSKQLHEQPGRLVVLLHGQKVFVYAQFSRFVPLSFLVLVSGSQTVQTVRRTF